MFEQRLEQLSHSLVMAWIDGLRCDLVQGDENECSFCKARMRNFQARFMNAQISYHQDIQIERARTVQQARGAITAVISLEIEQAVKEGARRHPGFESNDSVHETRLLGESNGLGGIERR